MGRENPEEATQKPRSRGATQENPGTREARVDHLNGKTQTAMESRCAASRPGVWYRVLVPEFGAILFALESVPASVPKQLTA